MGHDLYITNNEAASCSKGLIEMTVNVRQTYCSIHIPQSGFADCQILDGLDPIIRSSDCWVPVPFHDVRYTW